MPDESGEDARIGSVFAGKYELQRVLGRGATGVVYAAKNRESNETCAVKVFHRVEDGERIEQLLGEAKRASEIASEAVAAVLESGKTDAGDIYLVLELVEGERLDAFHRRRELSPEQIVDVAIQILFGLAATHARDIVHRDVKPETIFIVEGDDGKLRAKLTGFGTPGLIPEDYDGPLAALACLSPGHVKGEAIDRRSDVWSCGAMMFQLLAGRPVFEADTKDELLRRIREEDPPSLGDVAPSLPYWLVRMVDGALRRDRDKRWPSASQFAIGLRNAGAAPLDLDWEGHEDLTLQTSSMSGAEDAPAKGPATEAKREIGPSIVIDGADADEEDDHEALSTDDKTPTGLHAVGPDDRGGNPWVLVALIVVFAAAAWYLFGR